MSHFFAGLILIGLGLWGMVSWWPSFGFVMRGLVPFMLLSVGLIASLSGYRRLSPGRDAGILGD